jgi:UDP-hydrolysing UDP-N-acetyl-D-glucosamine 2-epimerase
MPKLNLTVVSTSRADLGIYLPFLRQLNDLPDLFNTQLIISGSHLFDDLSDDLKIVNNLKKISTKKVKIFDKSYTSLSSSDHIANAIKNFQQLFAKESIDLLVILGDRFEMFGVAIAAYNNLIPIAHIHGGELTAGSLDDGYRHSITKLSNFHFCSTEKSKKRIIQMGESPDRVFHIGSLGVENLKNQKLISKDMILDKLQISKKNNFCLLVIHPEKNFTDIESMVSEMIEEILVSSPLNIVASGSNVDNLGHNIDQAILRNAKNFPDRVYYFKNLGSLKYLSLLNHAEFIIGNSSSGIIEAPSLFTPTINIGLRQMNREYASSVSHIDWNIVELKQKISSIGVQSSQKFKNPYEKKDTSSELIDKILSLKPLSFNKGFFDYD